ncbi:energy-coupling factor transporter transmembrane component T [Pengzhenrongella frigida]|uniref:energy-coupling factor transporter transmembrane component T n=1 Tax=Pengzhenrongella frigida TaxID=1259133 RepID=UPI001F5DC578|nr:energy-coupling factor transporter transmembrane component T [Cellulomonas sp. HLT2-17]
MHPLAWWAWALGLAVAVTRTTNPLVIGMLLAATVLVVVVRRDDSPWARAFGAYLVLGVAIIAVRVAFYILVGIKAGGPVLLDLPSIAMPGWATGVELLGPVHLTGLLAAVYGGLRLAALIVCFGAANALANPKRALRCLPASLHHIGTAIVIAVTVTPQLVSSVVRVRRAQRLRGQDDRGLRSVLACALPVLADALDRSLALAASMDSRGYARSQSGRSDARITAALLVSLVAAALGTYGLLDGTSPDWLGLPLLAAGAVIAVGGSVLAGRRVRRTRYRPDPWGLPESLIAACGLAVALLLAGALGMSPDGLDPSLSPLTWPSVPPVALVATLLAAAPAVLRATDPGAVRSGGSR